MFPSDFQVDELAPVIEEHCSISGVDDKSFSIEATGTKLYELGRDISLFFLPSFPFNCTNKKRRTHSKKFMKSINPLIVSYI